MNTEITLFDVNILPHSRIHSMYNIWIDLNDSDLIQSSFILIKGDKINVCPKYFIFNF